MRELQTFSFTGTNLPPYATVTILIIGCTVNPVNDYRHHILHTVKESRFQEGRILSRCNNVNE